MGRSFSCGAGAMVFGSTARFSLSGLATLHVDALSIEELLAEYERLERTVVTVRRDDGSNETMNELRLRLEYECAT